MTDFTELEDLLKESVLLAQAKKAQAQQRKLSVNQSAIIGEMRKVEDKALWQTQAYFAHIKTITCTCGAITQALSGWYSYDLAKYGSGRRLTLVKDLEKGFPRKAFWTDNTSINCLHCIGEDLKVADVSDCNLLSSLLPKETNSGEPVKSKISNPSEEGILEEVEEVEEDLTELSDDIPFDDQDENEEEEYA